MAQESALAPPFVTRLAPSPTGALHLGNARTLGITWWWARAAGARLLLRVEDLDSPRKKPGAVEGLREDLAWLGIDHDGEVPIQTSRAPRHETVLRALVEAGAVYACVCSRRDVIEAQSAPHETPGDLAYAGTCRALGLDPADAAARAGRPVALRFRVPADRVAFDDLILGPQAFDLERESGDFVVGRALPDGGFAPGYQLAVVLDDADDGVTRVIRGQDLALSAARQIALARVLRAEPVTYAHVPLVVGPDGLRLAKRHGDTRLAALRARGVAADDVWRWITESVGRPYASRGALIAGGFDPAWVPRTPVVAPESYHRA